MISDYLSTNCIFYTPPYLVVAVCATKTFETTF